MCKSPEESKYDGNTPCEGEQGAPKVDNREAGLASHNEKSSLYFNVRALDALIYETLCSLQ